MIKSDTSDGYIGRNSLRLQGFDYAAKRYYFVTFVTTERRKVFLDSTLAKETIACLAQTRAVMQFKVYSYCLMPDHFHGLFGLAESGRTLSAICGAFKSLSTRVYWRWYEGKLWQRQYFDHIIRNDSDLNETLE
jgi:putative transposase